MLVEIAVGDAYGAGFEYADRTLILKNRTYGLDYLRALDQQLMERFACNSA